MKRQNKPKRTQSPFAGFPETKQIRKHGNLRFIIKPKTLTPQRAMIADSLGAFSVFGAMGYALYFVSLAPETPGWAWIGALVVPLCCTRLFQAIWRSALKKETRFEIEELVFTQRRFPVSTSFDRSLPHKFSLLPHDKAEAEKEAHERAIRAAQMKGHAISKKRYYGESFHLSYEYLGHRNDLLTIFGRKEAVAVAARLKACDDVMNTQTGYADGVALNPDDQWPSGPGEIE